MIFYNKIKSRLGVFTSLLIATLITGCVKEDRQINTLGGDLTIGLSARSVIGPTEDELIVSDVRIVVMKGSTVIFNKSTKGGLVEEGSATAGTSRFILPLKSGSYKIAVVGNETQAMTTQLDAVKTFSDLSAIQVADKFTGKNIPLYRELNVAIRHLASDPTKGEVQIDGEVSWNSELDMPLERIQTKVSLFVRKNTGNDKTIVIHKAELAQVPKFVYLSPRSFNHTDYQTITPYNNATGITLDVNRTESNEDNTSYKEVFSTENIFPENNMNNPSDKTKATKLKLQGTYGGAAVNYEFDLNINANYTLLRNVHYKIYATITSDGDIESQDIVVSPELWNGEKIDVELLTPYLNVQELNLVLNLSQGKADNHYHLHYWTNQTSTLVEPKMKRFDDKSGDVVMDVSTVFNNLSGVGAANNHFDTQVPGSASYTGYLDININTDYVLPHATNQFRIVLNANGLRREITITIAVAASLNPTHIGYTPWIGTFHRWNQTGERVIAAEHTGDWSAKVMDDVSNSSNFVVITKSTSTDPALGTDNPDDAENHQLLGELNVGAELLHDAKSITGITGTGKIYFRIGLKSTLSSPTAKPRYARVELTAQSGTYYLYVRQGEADDYLYDTNDPDVVLMADGSSTSPVGSVDRTQARKISPYNLGVSRPTAGGETLNNHYQFASNEKGVFVNYPTMAGWYFTWYFCGSTPYYKGAGSSSLIEEYDDSYRRAYHPYNPAYNTFWRIYKYPSITGDTPNKFSYYVPNKNNDPCPVGYEMMSSEEVLHSLYKSYIKIDEEYNKSTQFKVQDRSVINYLWGYYADGYYDRRPTRTLTHGGGDNYYRPYQIAGYNADVAYMGVLFYNDDLTKNNSVFLPGGGTRSGTTDTSSPNHAGALSHVGGRAVYFLENSFQKPGDVHLQNGVGAIELGAQPGSSSDYQAPTTSTYSFNFAFNSLGSHATPMRCVRTSYPKAEASVIVFDWNGATPDPLNTTVAGTTDNTHTAKSGSTISFIAGGDFISFNGASFDKGGSVTFNGWNTKANGTGTTYNAGSSMGLTSGVHILYAQWK